MYSLQTRWIKWLLSVIYLVIFAPQLSNEIATNNHNLIITLTTIENWDNEGISNHNFNLIHSWGNPGDLGVHYYKRVMNQEGRNYFVSYPPFATIAIYPFLKLLPQAYYPIGFKLFGMFIHILTFFLLLHLLKKLKYEHALFSAALFLFFPASIVLSGMYYPEQLILLVLILLTSQILKGTKLIALGFLSFILVYTDWLGWIAITVIGASYLFQFKLVRQSQFYAIVLGGIIGGGLVAFQYSLIDGVEGLIHGLKIRYIERAGLFPERYSDRGVNIVSFNSWVYYLVHLGPLLLIPVVLALVFKYRFRAIHPVVFCVIVLPILIHLVVLFNSNILHFQNLSKLGLLFCFLPLQKLQSKFVPLTILGLLLYGFFVSNWYWEKYPVDQKNYADARRIKSNNRSNDVVIVSLPQFEERLVLLSYLTQRNLVWAANIQDVQEILEESNQTDYVWIDLE